MEAVLRACLAVGAALQALHLGAPGPVVVASLDQAGAAVRDLQSPGFAGELRGVLDEIDRCRRDGDCASARLDKAVETAVHALAAQR
ncbi:MAG: hypothetical protein ACRDSN_24255 [Pseudonocardiaceae bacterium]